MPRKQLSQYLRETITIKGDIYNETDIDDFKKAWKLIKVQCKPFLKELKSNGNKEFLYRGIRGVDDDIIIRNVRKDRNPKDTPYSSHAALDRAFHDIHGWNARSGGMFCTGKTSTAGSYGNTFMVFPIGDYKYLWSNSITDLYSYTDDGNLASEAEPSYTDYREWESEWEEIYGEDGEGEWYYSGDNYGVDLNHAIETILTRDFESLDDEGKEEYDNDVDVYIKKYHDDVKNYFKWVPDVDKDVFMDDKRENWSPDESDMESMADDIIKRGKYKDDDLKGALSHSSGTEIMVNCEKYWAINKEVFYQLAKLVIFEDGDPDQLEFDFNK